jgi:NAD(P)-dependent dehydrogenase (short-subunit alcohol dehydrogenase family)
MEDRGSMAGKRVALVTGSGKRRLGRSVALALAERGYALALHYHTSAVDAAEAVDAICARQAEAEAFGADLGGEEGAKALVQATLDRFGRIDVLVNCAAIWQPKPLHVSNLPSRSVGQDSNPDAEPVRMGTLTHKTPRRWGGVATLW